MRKWGVLFERYPRLQGDVIPLRRPEDLMAVEWNLPGYHMRADPWAEERYCW
jgi:hypothetical protein